jgi:uncharacterized protein YjgD (DUF1641 family)
MAKPIPFEVHTLDPRAELESRLRDAPLEHAEALLAAYEVLQGLHERGVFELLRGALGSSDKVIEIIVEAAKAPASIRSIRNGLIVVKTLAVLEPEQVGALARSLPEALTLVKATSLLEAVGRNVLPT